MKGRGGRIDARLNERILSAVGAVNDIADVNGVADHLRSKHPEYKRHKYIPFATQVGFALQHLHSTGKVRPAPSCWCPLRHLPARALQLHAGTCQDANWPDDSSSLVHVA